jgi:Tol biopolymer transport system component
VNLLTAPQCAALACIALLASSVATVSAGTLAVAPEIFAPGVISGAANDGTPTFTPDGKTLFFTRSGTGAGTILESHLAGGRWSTPQIASFSGEWNDQHAAVAPNGSYLVFVSTRPAPGLSKRVAHLWRVDRTSAGWGMPVHLPAAVNIGPRIFKPSVAADGTIYFLSIGNGRTFRLYRSKCVGGAYQPAEPLPFSTDATRDVDPEIAPDQSFLVFSSSGRRSKDDTKEHLFIVVNRGGAWGAVTPLRYAGDDENGSSNDNEPDLGPDGRTLYFSSDRSPALHFPRTRSQADADLMRMESWDNGNANVWTLSLTPSVINSGG